MEIEGFKFLPSNSMKGIFPDWYQNVYLLKST